MEKLLPRIEFALALYRSLYIDRSIFDRSTSMRRESMGIDEKREMKKD